MNDKSLSAAEALNAELRAERPTAPAPDATAEPAAPSFGDRLHAQWMLPEPARLDDLPRLRPFARVPALGALLSFIREAGSALWLLAKRRSLIMQQVRFNQAVADAVIYLQDMAEAGAQIDREVQALKSEAGALDASAAAMDADLRARAEQLSARLDRLEERLAAIERALAARADG